MQRLALILTALLTALSADMGATTEWTYTRTIEGVTVEYQETESGFHRHRGEAAVCADLVTLEAFVADTSRFADWVPFTREVRLLEQTSGGVTYYVRSATPWPLKDRDMVYRLTREDTEPPLLRISLTGLPDYLAPVESADRIRAASGEWRLIPAGGTTRVVYELYLHPGSVPRTFANRRLATAVGKTLANLRAEFACDATGDSA